MPAGDRTGSPGRSDPGRQGDVFYATLMRFAGCAATSHELGRAFGGDDIAVRARGDLIDMARPREALRSWRVSGPASSGSGAAARPAASPKLVAEGGAGRLRGRRRSTRRLRLPAAVDGALLDVFERCDGKGGYRGRAGEEIAVPARFAAVGSAPPCSRPAAGVRRRPCAGGRAGARSGNRRRVPRGPGELLRSPSPRRPLGRRDRRGARATAHVRDTGPDDALARFADAADLKAPFLQGTPRRRRLAARGGAAGLSRTSPTCAAPGSLHDIGRVRRDGRLGETRPARAAEWEQVRLHAYHIERILARAPMLARSRATAGRHHERTDGCGYPAASPGRARAAARFLAAADVYHAMSEPRPHRPALTAAAARLLSSAAPGPRCGPGGARGGRRTRRRRCRPAGRPDRPRAGGAAAARRRAPKRRSRRGCSLPLDRAHAHRAHLRKVRRSRPAPASRCSRCSTAWPRRASQDRLNGRCAGGAAPPTVAGPATVRRRTR